MLMMTEASSSTRMQASDTICSSSPHTNHHALHRTGMDDSMGSFLHDVGEAEHRGAWARVRVDMGTCDELALDVLINMFMGFRCGPIGSRDEAWG